MGFKTQNDSERPCRDNGVMKLKVTCYNHKQQNLALNHLKWFTDLWARKRAHLLVCLIYQRSYNAQ